MSNVPTSGDDVLIGTTGPDVIDALAGNDQVFGAGGADDLRGGVGNDTIYGGDGNDRIDGGDGEDKLYGDAGEDTLTYTGSSDTGVEMHGGSDNDRLSASSYSATMYGDDGDDTLDARSSFFFQLDGGSDNDLLIGGSGGGYLAGGDGDDVLKVEKTAGGYDFGIALNGGSGNDTLIYNGPGNYTVELRGGSGNDKLSATGYAANVYGDDGDDTLERIDGTDPDGNDAHGVMSGGAGNDTIKGASGSDMLRGGSGNDTLTGGAGVDTFYGSSEYIYDPTIGGFGFRNSLHGDTITDYQSGERIDLGQSLSSVAQVQLVAVGSNTELLIDIDNNGSFETAVTLLGDVTGTLFVASENGYANNIIQIFKSGDNVPPVAASDSYDATEDQTLTIATANGVLRNDMDANGDALKATRVTGPANGSLTLNSDGSFSYTPRANFNGTDSFTYRANDGTADSAPIVVTLKVGAVNDAPIAANDGEFATSYNTPLTIPLAALLANDWDIDRGSNETLSITAVDAAMGGTVALLNGDVVFTPTSGYYGSASFRYTVSNGVGGVATAVVSLDIGSAPPINIPTNGHDVLVGTEGPDSIDGLAGDDHISGLAGDDVLRGSDGNDTIYGGDGDDRIEGGGGADTLYGDGGNDTIAGIITTGFLGADYYKLTDIHGGAGNDMLSASGYAFISGDDGNDTITSYGGYYSSITVSGGAGSDALTGYSGNFASTEMYGGNGNDVLLIGYDLNKFGTYAEDGTVLYGEEGDDTLDAGYTYYFQLDGGSGNDVLVGGRGYGSMSGGDGNDTLDASRSYGGSVQVITLDGGTGNDMLTGGPAISKLIGGDGDDVLIVGTGRGTSMTGGAGADTYRGYGLDNGENPTTDPGAIVDNTLNYSIITDYAYGERIDFGMSLSAAAQIQLISVGSNTQLRVDIDNDGILETAVTLLGAVSGKIVLYSENGYNNNILRIVAPDVTGTPMNDVLIGTDEPDTIDGLAGNDQIFGLVGNDTLTGNDGDDALYGNEDDDTLIGGSGVDTLNGGSGNDMLSGGEGADTLVGGSGIDTADYSGSYENPGVYVDLSRGVGFEGDAAGDRLSGIENVIGTVHADTLIGDSSANLLFGDGDNDILEGRAGADVLDGGGNRDTASYASSQSGVRVDLGAGQGVGGDAEGDRWISIEDVVGSRFYDTLIGDAGNNILSGGDGNDVLNGGAGSNTLNGGAGDDIFEGSLGLDRIVGGSGNDTVNYSRSATGVFAELSTGVGFAGDAAYDTFNGVENLIGSAFGDTLAGDGGANILNGGGGNDTLVGGAGDTLIGGDGTDTASYTRSQIGVLVDLSSGLGFGDDGGSHTLVGIENLAGSRYADTLLGNAIGNVLDGSGGDDTLDGGAGADILLGGAGSDTASYARSADGVRVELSTGFGFEGDAEGDRLSGIEKVIGSAYDDDLVGNTGYNILDGGDGNDVLAGGAGNDTLIGGAGIDTASYAASRAAVQIDLLAGTAQGGDAGGDTLSGIENILGSAFNDTLRGDANANALTGGAGNDLLSGGAGADTLIGGDGTDTASYAASLAGVRIDLAAGTARGGDAGGDVLFGIESLTGSAFDDILVGDSGNNVIDGSAGRDTLTGGGGADRFVFSTALAASVNIDTVTDFDIASDIIQLSRSVFAALDRGGLHAADFTIGTTAATATQNIVYDRATGHLFYDADGTGSGAQTQFATLAAGLNLTNDDFFVV